ncbi:hypothetical protein BGX30_010482 [Mortierella sp. GBA39]|nr:hypothetical protein BGX30_010482 [Mortierella sp. GBA39]
MTTANVLRIVLGSMTFGLDTTDASTSAVKVRGPAAVAPFLAIFHSHGYTEVDTARFYGSGDCETVLSQVPNPHMKISTKIFPYVAGSHNREN